MTDQIINTKRNFLIEALGWYGVFALLGAYTLLTFGVLASNNLWYQILNVTGAAGIIIDALHQKNYQPAVLNIVWALVGIIALINILK